MCEAVPGLTPDAALEMPLAQAIQFRTFALQKRGQIMRPPGGGSVRAEILDILGEDGARDFCEMAV